MGLEQLHPVAGPGSTSNISEAESHTSRFPFPAVHTPPFPQTMPKQTNQPNPDLLTPPLTPPSHAHNYNHNHTHIHNNNNHHHHHHHPPVNNTPLDPSLNINNNKTNLRRPKFPPLPLSGPSFTHFDRQNPQASTSPYHGFFTLFWTGIALWTVKICAENWREYGHPLGGNEIMRVMFDGREVWFMLGADAGLGLVAGLVGWGVQRQVLKGGLLDWERGGWVVQSVSFFFSSFVLGGFVLFWLG